MADPVYSPDGKFMWTGKEWIPAPPSGEDAPNQPSEQTINMQDSVIGGDVVHKTVINNDPVAVTSAVIAALQQMGMVGQAPSVPVAPPVPEVELQRHSMLVIMLNIIAQPMLAGLTVARSLESMMMEPTESRSPRMQKLRQNMRS